MSLQLADLQIIAREQVVAEYQVQLAGVTANLTSLQQELEDAQAAHMQQLADLTTALD